VFQPCLIPRQRYAKFLQFRAQTPALKFFPAATDVETGLAPDPWVILTVGDIKCEVHVPRGVTLESFEEEAWWQFDRLRKDLKLNDVAGEKFTEITID